MTYVPIVVPPQVPSHQTRELADLLGRVITEYEKAHPSVSHHEVREAAHIAVRATSRGGAVGKNAVVIAAGVLLLMAGVVAYFFSSGGLGSGLAGPFPVIAVIAFVGVLLPLIMMLRRGDL